MSTLTIDTLRALQRQLASAAPLAGLRIVESRQLTERRQVRFPRSKARRIRKKWARRASSYRERPMQHGYMIGSDTLVVHPALAARLRARLEAAPC